MDEDRLSPELGRLIDEAKAAAGSMKEVSAETEGVALLMEDGAVCTGAGSCSNKMAKTNDLIPSRIPRSLSAAGLALEDARERGLGEILAAAVAAPRSPSETVLPGVESYRCLADVDPEMPLVFKQRGRWVVLPLSRARSDS